jgi:tetratricopeptide (TPR) repeat protein
MLDVLLTEYINNPENDYANYNLALEYERIGQTAAAISFLLRASERTEDKNLAYDCLIKIGQCFDKQGDRNYTVRSMFQSAIALIPERPEGYYFISRRYEHDKNYFESYVYCQIALDVSNTDNKNVLGYPGKWALMFQKAVAAWWCGKGMESRKLLQVLVDE